MHSGSLAVPLSKSIVKASRGFVLHDSVGERPETTADPQSQVVAFLQILWRGPRMSDPSRRTRHDDSPSRDGCGLWRVNF